MDQFITAFTSYRTIMEQEMLPAATAGDLDTYFGKPAACVRERVP